jgi:hypothetical protein
MIDFRKSHDRSRGFDLFLIGLALFGVWATWFGVSHGGAWMVLSALALIGEALLGYGVFIEPKRIVVKRYREPLVRDPSVWLRIVLLSDFHTGSFKKADWYERVIQEVIAIKPDVALLGGDFVTDKHDPIMDMKSVTQIIAPLGKYFVIGNHDHMDDPQRIRDAVAAFGYEDLSNRMITVEREGKKLELSAIDDLWFGAVKREKRSSPSVPHLLLSHEPDVLLDLKEGDADLVVCGHTHAGQIRLPFIGPLWPIPTKLGRAADMGRKVMNGVPCIISNGLGETDGRMRLFSPPEITVVEVGI